MQIRQALGKAQIHKLNALAHGPELSDIYAPALSAKNADFFRAMGAKYGCVCSRFYWANIQKCITKGGRWVIYYVNNKCVINDFDFLFKRMPKVCLTEICDCLKAKCGCVFLENGEITHVTWRNWKQFYAKFLGPKDNRVYDTPISARQIQNIREQRKREQGFAEISETHVYEKPRKRAKISHDAPTNTHEYARIQAGVLLGVIKTIKL